MDSHGLSWQEVLYTLKLTYQITPKEEGPLPPLQKSESENLGGADWRLICDKVNMILKDE